jgi:hypothetical protein
MAAPEGNKYAEKYTLDEWIEIFEGIYEKAMNGDFLSLQQAFIESDVRPSTQKWLCQKYEALATIKKDIGEAIVNTVNKGGLKSQFNPAMAIWRMKQLGEVEKQVIEQNNTTVNLTPEERKERIEQLKNKL